MNQQGQSPRYSEQTRTANSYKGRRTYPGFRTSTRMDTPGRQPYLDFAIKKEIIRFKLNLELINPRTPLNQDFIELLQCHLSSCFPNSGIDGKLVTIWSTKYAWIMDRNGVPPGASGPALLSQVHAEFATVFPLVNPETSSASSNIVQGCSGLQHSPDLGSGLLNSPCNLTVESRCCVLESGYSKMLQIFESVKSILDAQLGKEASPAGRKSYPKTPKEVTRKLIQVRNQIRIQENIFISNNSERNRQIPNGDISQGFRNVNLKSDKDDDVQVVFDSFFNQNEAPGPSGSAGNSQQTGQFTASLASPSTSLGYSGSN